MLTFFWSTLYNKKHNAQSRDFHWGMLIIIIICQIGSWIDTAQSPRAVEYANCISAMSVLDMTLNGIWWWGSSPEALGNVEYSFIAITPRSTLTLSGSTC